MKWLPKEKRNSFIIVVVVTVAVLALIGFGLLRSQKSTLARAVASRQAAETQLQSIDKTIKNAELTTNELAVATTALSRAEADVASGDSYSWAYNTIRQFKQQYKIEIPDIGHPVEDEVTLIPSFPYRQMSLVISGKGYYHDIGKFVADFENNFPHIRVTSLAIEQSGSDGEKLSFRMEITALIKSNAS